MREILTKQFESTIKPLRFVSFPKPVRNGSKTRKFATKRGRKGKKGKIPSRKSLVRKLDEIVSKIVIDSAVYRSCVICGSTKQLGAGHIFSRSHYSTRWDIYSGGNVYAQCWPCNYKHKVSDPMPYYNWYQDKFGRKKFEALYNRWKTIKKFSNKDLELLIKKYEKKY